MVGVGDIDGRYASALRGTWRIYALSAKDSRWGCNPIGALGHKGKNARALIEQKKCGSKKDTPYGVGYNGQKNMRGFGHEEGGVRGKIVSDAISRLVLHH